MQIFGHDLRNDARGLGGVHRFGASVRLRRSFSTAATEYQTTPPPRFAAGLDLNRGTFAVSNHLRSVSAGGTGSRKLATVVSLSTGIVASRAGLFDVIESMPQQFAANGFQATYPKGEILTVSLPLPFS